MAINFPFSFTITIFDINMQIACRLTGFSLEIVEYIFCPYHDISILP